MKYITLFQKSLYRTQVKYLNEVLYNQRRFNLLNIWTLSFKKAILSKCLLCVCAEIPGFLSDDECRVVMQLAQLKGLMESQLMVQDGQEELAKELNLSPEEIFNLLDINQDGQLQLHEVYVPLFGSPAHTVTALSLLGHVDNAMCPLCPSDRYWLILEWGTASGWLRRIWGKSMLDLMRTRIMMVKQPLWWWVQGTF